MTKQPSTDARTPHLIELRLWRQFVAVAEELHFSRAAQRLNMTQPPLTQAIAQLEATLGLRLFDRTKRSVQLTAAGAALVPEARDLLARASALPVFARASADGEAGRLRLAFVSTAGFDVLPRWVRAFREQHPKVQLELIEATGDVQLEAIGRGEIDAGFMLHSPGFAPPGLACQLIARESLVVAVPGQSALATKGTLALKDLLDQPLVIFPRRILPSLYDAIFAMYHAAGYLPCVAQEAIQMQTIVNLVSAGIGVAWVPDSVRQFQRPGVVYREPAVAKGQGVPGCETSLVWSACVASPALSRFMAFAPG
ncbi:LysR family transcriptional regulator [Polaromonas naphthalenivorans]|uniref:Transcriptional regulator, LysR family n=1 Tax=Polaromonas naphthalenivorans (strain CJ2) TaxID=365044 RepID=A1VR97_POLNA|nr:LysR family transcriptional regulator [Polaromonas naphthalenivorans]ABM38175.1 transcriptional regulator, LysR family [Polaromonas naphthalenivorans CJ2]